MGGTRATCGAAAARAAHRLPAQIEQSICAASSSHAATSACSFAPAAGGASLDASETATAFGNGGARSLPVSEASGVRATRVGVELGRFLGDASERDEHERDPLVAVEGAAAGVDSEE